MATMFQDSVSQAMRLTMFSGFFWRCLVLKTQIHLVDSYTKLPTSSTNASGSPLLCGQTSNSNASSTIPFGSKYMSGQIKITNLFGLNSTSDGGTSMGLFGSMQGTPSSAITWGSSSRLKSDGGGAHADVDMANGELICGCQSIMDCKENSTVGDCRPPHGVKVLAQQQKNTSLADVE